MWVSCMKFLLSQLEFKKETLCYRMCVDCCLIDCCFGWLIDWGCGCVCGIVVRSCADDLLISLIEWLG